MKLKTKHLFKLITIIKKANLTSELKTLFIGVDTKGLKKEDLAAKQTELGVDLMLAIASGLDLAEAEIYALLADLKGITPEEVANQDINVTFDDLKEIVASPVVQDFLGKAVV